MRLSAWGMLLGAGVAVGLLLVVARVRVIRRPPLASRVLPYLRDLSGAPGRRLAAGREAVGPFLPALRRAGDLLERLLGGASVVQRRLIRAGLMRTAQDFRVEQVVWGLVGFSLAAGWGLLHQLTMAGRGRAASGLATLVICVVAFVVGMVCRDSHLTRQVARRERRIVAEFPTVAELLALAVAAGESPVGALDRVVARASGPLRDELAGVLGDIRTGTPAAAAFDGLGTRSGLPILARFAGGIATAIERGTPLSDVLHAQGADVREAGRRALIEAAARKEVFMMAPVVLLVLPAVVLVVLYPGLLDLHLDAG